MLLVWFMISEQQQQANRANAQLSTGPKTQEGKKRSSLNALRHGLNSQAVLLPNEDAIAFARHAKKCFDDLKPKGFLEEQLTQSLADLSWRINRMRNMETNLLAAACHALESNVETEDSEVHAALTMARAYKENCADILRLGQHEARAAREFQRNLNELKTLQTERRAAEASEMQDATLIRNMQKSKGIAWNPSDDGFVPSIAEIDAHIRRHELLKRAKTFAQGTNSAASRA